MLDYRTHTFLEVYRQRSFTRAAEALLITQPAVSQHIRQLEAHYGCALFTKTGRGVEPTAAANLIYQRLLAMENDEGRLMAEAAELAARPAGVDVAPLRFGCTRTIADYVAPRLMAAHLTAHPDASVTLRAGNTRDLVCALDRGEIDFALVEGSFDRSLFAFETLSREDYIAVAAPGGGGVTGAGAGSGCSAANKDGTGSSASGAAGAEAGAGGFEAEATGEGAEGAGAGAASGGGELSDAVEGAGVTMTGGDAWGTGPLGGTVRGAGAASYGDGTEVTTEDAGEIVGAVVAAADTGAASAAFSQATSTRTHTSPASIRELLGQRLILREAGSGTREILEKHLAARDLAVEDFAGLVELESIPTIKACVRAGAGISFMYRAAVEAELAAGELVDITPADFQVEHDFCLIWQRGSQYAPRYRTLCTAWRS